MGRRRLSFLGDVLVEGTWSQHDKINKQREMTKRKEEKKYGKRGYWGTLSSPDNSLVIAMIKETGIKFGGKLFMHSRSDRVRGLKTRSTN